MDLNIRHSALQKCLLVILLNICLLLQLLERMEDLFPQECLMMDMMRMSGGVEHFVLYSPVVLDLFVFLRLS